MPAYVSHDEGKPLFVSHADYLMGIVDDVEGLASELLTQLPKFDPFDTIVGTGLSGALVVPALARRLDKYWAIVRKERDGSHSDVHIEGNIGDRWLFVDDLLSSGKSFQHCWDALMMLRDTHGFVTCCVGVWTYGHKVCYTMDLQPIYDREWKKWEACPEAQNAIIPAAREPKPSEWKPLQWDLNEIERRVLDELLVTKPNLLKEQSLADIYQQLSTFADICNDLKNDPPF